jgi:uncharacterized protein YndB with AHSA1/START domain
MSRSTQVSQIIHAPRETVYRAFIDPNALVAWLPPEGMRGEVHAFDPRDGGAFRLSLTYLEPDESAQGKTSDDTDTVEGRFSELRPDERIVWITTFDSEDPAFAGGMRITWTLAAADHGTDVTVLCEHIPVGIRLEDNAEGSRSSLRQLAAFVEQREAR